MEINLMSDKDHSINNETTVRGGIGSVLGRIDQYELVRELGGGGFGTVYLAKDTVAGIEVAVKGLPPMIKNNAEELERIRENFALVSRLHHPYIAAVLHLHPARVVAYFDESVKQKLRVMPGDTLVVMEYAPGVTLSKWRKQFPGGIVPLEDAVQLVWQIAQALDYAHEQHIIHRDIKPSNIMVETKPDGNLVVRVLDFGLAAEIRSSMGRVSQDVCDTSGTRPYMTPEQWSGDSQNAATDQYALAVLLHEMLVGKVPFASVFDTGDPVIMLTVVTTRSPNIPSGLPRTVRLALEKALAKEPSRRFKSCAEFVDVLKGSVVHTSRPWRLIAGSLCVAVLVSMGMWLGISGKHKAPVPLDPDPSPDPVALRSETVVPDAPTNIPPSPSPNLNPVMPNPDDGLKQEKLRLLTGISTQYRLATNIFNQIACYRDSPEGFSQHLEKVDLLWNDISNIVLSHDATLDQITNVLVSVSNAVATINVEKAWLAKNKEPRDEIMTMRRDANMVCSDIRALGGTHWQTLLNYINGTNSLENGSAMLDKGELKAAMESIMVATNLLGKAYFEEQEFVTREKKAEAERKAREIAEHEAEEKHVAENARAYTNCLVQIALLRRDASNEYAKLSLVRQNSRGFAPRLLTIDKLWDVINDNSQADTFVGIQGTYTSTSNALQQIKEEIEWVIGHKSLRDNIQAKGDVTMHAIRRLQDDVTLGTQAWTTDPRYISATSRYARAHQCFTEGMLSKDLANELLAICNEIEQLHKDMMNGASEQLHKDLVSSEPVVKSVTIRQAAETKEVVVSYVLENSRAFITLDFLQDGKAAFPKGTVRTIFGDVNKWVEPGIRQIIWKCVDDIPDKKIDGIAAKVTAHRQRDIEHDGDGEKQTEETDNANFAGDNEEEMPKNQIVLRTYVLRQGSRHYVTPTDFGTKANYKMFLKRLPQYLGSVVIVESSKLNTPTFIVSLACGKYKGKVALSFKKAASETIDVELKEEK